MGNFQEYSNAKDAKLFAKERRESLSLCVPLRMPQRPLRLKKSLRQTLAEFEPLNQILKGRAQVFTIEPFLMVGLLPRLVT
jgi:hypothetical protein